jgi:mono/diheme cytochrome c family protein
MESVPRGKGGPRAHEGAEPVAGTAPVPGWIYGLIAIVLYVGEIYVMNNGGDLQGKTGYFPVKTFDPFLTMAQVDAVNPKVDNPLLKGAQVYEKNCLQCHQPSGMGSPGQFPPLAGADWAQEEDPKRIIRLVLNGGVPPFTVNGQAFAGAMFPFRDSLSDNDIASVLSFVRNNWGNKAPFVKPEQVKAIREATAGRSAGWTEAELRKE